MRTGEIRTDSKRLKKRANNLLKMQPPKVAKALVKEHMQLGQSLQGKKKD